MQTKIDKKKVQKQSEENKTPKADTQKVIKQSA